jgi:hypothetical protein
VSPTNAKEFGALVTRAARELAAEQIVLLQRVISIEALRRVIEKTPVDTGRTRANWQLSIGVIKTSVLESTDTDGGDTLSKGIDKLTGLGPYRVVYISNNVNHILVLEEGLYDPADPGPSKDPRPGRKGEVLVRGGFSVQAPQGMVAVTIEELKGMFR